MDENTALKRFKKLARSLSLYGRHTVESVEVDSFDNLEKVYIDPLPDNGAVETILGKRFSLILGRKGTGKSILFNVCQEKLSKSSDSIGAYINCLEIYQEESYDLVTKIEKYKSGLEGVVDSEAISDYLLRRHFIEKLLVDLLSEVENKVLGNWKEKFLSVIGMSKFDKAKEKIQTIKSKIANPDDVDIQLLKQKHIEKREKLNKNVDKKVHLGMDADGKASANALVQEGSAEGSASAAYENVSSSGEEVLDFQDYSSMFVSIFRPRDILRDLFLILQDLKIKKLFLFIDDYSELPLEYQGIISNSILTQYHQMTEFPIHISIAAYPNRCFLGSSVDKSKVTPLNIDFDKLYEDKSLPEKHNFAIDFVASIMERRLSVFCPNDDFFDFFNKGSSSDKKEFYKVLFQASYNCPRIMGAVLEKSIQTDLAHGKKIGLPSIRSSARTFYEDRVSSFIRQSKYSIRPSDIPFYTPIDVFNQLELLDKISDALKDAQTNIYDSKTYGEHYGKQPPVSHFHVSEKYDDVFKFLINNFFINKVSEQQVKTGKLTATIYSLNLGLCEKKNMKYWEPDSDRKFRNYLIERFFYFDDFIDKFLDQQKEIVCTSCDSRFSIAEKDTIQGFHWMCKNCGEKTCEVRDVNYDKTSALLAVPEGTKLPSEEIEILEALNEYQTVEEPIFPKQIAGFIDNNYQFVTRRMIKLSHQDYGFVEYFDQIDGPDKGRRVYRLSDKAKGSYF